MNRKETIMHKHDMERIKFYGKEDGAVAHYLLKAEKILRSEIKPDYPDLNDVIELYHIKKYMDNDAFLTTWTTGDISDFREKAIAYGKIVGKSISKINDGNIMGIYENLVFDLVESFWELFNNQSLFKKIARPIFASILSKDPHSILDILKQKNTVDHYHQELRGFLLGHENSARILLSVYEEQDSLTKSQTFIPRTLSLSDKETIISAYLDNEDANLNYVRLIQNARNRADFKISDKTRLKAKRLEKKISEKIFKQNPGIPYGVSIEFSETANSLKEADFDDNNTAHHKYSLQFLKEHPNHYQLFHNFRFLIEYMDAQYRINLVSKESQLGVFERFMGVHSKNEYPMGVAFSFSEMVSHAQIVAYANTIKKLDVSLEEIIYTAFTKALPARYDFADNARLSMPNTASSFFEKVRLMAPEFETVLKQFKLFVEDGHIDFELLQISSSPTSIREIPSLNANKYIYFNQDHEEMRGCSNLFFSDQSMLTYVDPYKDKSYQNFIDLLANEQVLFDSYQEYQKRSLNYLASKGLIYIDDAGFIKIRNEERVTILKDLYENKFASFHRYPANFQSEVAVMVAEKIVFFESSLFSKQEQEYFNYFLNKSEFTNGLDLRNSYLHGTQAHPEDVNRHEYSYFTYLKLLVLAILKIDDDLQIWHHLKN